MATFSQLLASAYAQQRLGQKESEGVLGTKIKESEDVLADALRAYQEEAERTGRQFEEYERKGKEAGAAQTAISFLNPIAGAVVGGILRGTRDKPKFRLNLETAVPGFSNILFGKQRQKDLISSVEGTRQSVSSALEGSLLADFVNTAVGFYSATQMQDLLKGDDSLLASTQDFGYTDPDKLISTYGDM